MRLLLSTFYTMETLLSGCINYGPFLSSDLIFNNHNHSTCFSEEETSQQFETVTTLTVNRDCVSSDKVNASLLCHIKLENVLGNKVKRPFFVSVSN